MDTRDPRLALELRICEFVAKGWTLEMLARQPGFPNRRTVTRWSRENPVFALALKQARAWWRGEVGWQRAGWCFNADQAERLIAQVRRGASVAELLRRPEFPRRKILNRWKLERPDFAAELAAAAAISRRLRGTRWRSYDEAVADRIICRVNAGERLAQVAAEPGLPGVAVVRRWRRAKPGFDYAMKMAVIGGRRRRAAARRKLSPELAQAICRRVADGATIEALGEAKGMPHRVTLQRWMRRDPGFAEQVRAAQAERDEPLAEEVLRIAEAATPETLAEAKRRIAGIKQVLGARGRKGRPS